MKPKHPVIRYEEICMEQCKISGAIDSFEKAIRASHDRMAELHREAITLPLRKDDPVFNIVQSQWAQDFKQYANSMYIEALEHATNPGLSVSIYDLRTKCPEYSEPIYLVEAVIDGEPTGFIMARDRNLEVLTDLCKTMEWIVQKST